MSYKRIELSTKVDERIFNIFTSPIPGLSFFVRQSVAFHIVGLIASFSSSAILLLVEPLSGAQNVPGEHISIFQLSTALMIFAFGYLVFVISLLVFLKPKSGVRTIIAFTVCVGHPQSRLFGKLLREQQIESWVGDARITFTGTGVPQNLSTDTDQRGDFNVQFPTPPGTYIVQAHFAGLPGSSPSDSQVQMFVVTNPNVEQGAIADNTH